MSDFADIFAHRLSKSLAAVMLYNPCWVLGQAPYPIICGVPSCRAIRWPSSAQPCAQRAGHLSLEKLQLHPLTTQTKRRVLLIITGGIAAYKGT